MTGGTDGSDHQRASSSRVLLCTSESRIEPSRVRAAITEHATEPPESILGVTLACTPAEWEAAWQETTVETRSIDVGTLTRSTSADVDPNRAAIDPTAVHAMGRAILDELRDSESGDPVSICVYTLTALLQHVEQARAFRLVHVLGELAARHGGSLYLVVETDVHDGQTIATFSTICDVVRV